MTELIQWLLPLAKLRRTPKANYLTTVLANGEQPFATSSEVFSPPQIPQLAPLAFRDTLAGHGFRKGCGCVRESATALLTPTCESPHITWPAKPNIPSQLSKERWRSDLVEEASAASFEDLLDPIDGLTNVIKEVTADPGLDRPRLLFVKLKSDQPQVEALAELLTDLLVDYAIPLKKRQQANALGAGSKTGGHTAAHSRLQREAKRLFIEYDPTNTGRYGELGELLSYAIAIHYLGAAQIGSKMALKTSRGMPVHGVDGLHAKANPDGTVTFFLLESKIVPDAADASRQMVESIAEHRADRVRQLNELRLVNDLSNLDALQGEQRGAAKSFFNAYEGSGNHLKRRDVHLGSLVFSEDAYLNRIPVDHNQSITIHEERFEEFYKAKHQRFQQNLARQAAAKGLDLGHCVVFLIAVPDVNELKRVFSELNK